MAKPRTECVGIADIGPDKIAVYLSPRLHTTGGCEGSGYRSGDKVFFSRANSRAGMIDTVAGFVCMLRTKQIAGDGEWGSGFAIGKRQFKVRTVKLPRGVEPFTYMVDIDAGEILIVAEPDIAKFIMRVIAACNSAWDKWRTQALERALCREKPRVDRSAAEDDPTTAAKPERKAKPRVRPGELLPPGERDAMLRQGDEVIRRLMGESNEGHD